MDFELYLSMFDYFPSPMMCGEDSSIMRPGFEFWIHYQPHGVHIRPGIG